MTVLLALTLALPAAANQATDPAFAVVEQATLSEAGQGVEADNNPPVGTTRYVDVIDNCARTQARSCVLSAPRVR